MSFSKDWWNEEYKEPSTKASQDSIKSDDVTITFPKGTLKHSCKDYVVYKKDWFRSHYGAEIDIMLGDKQYLEQSSSEKPNKSEIPTGSTTKNDLGVDCISRQSVADYIDYIQNHGMGKKKLFDFIKKFVANLHPATPIRPKGHWEHGKELSREYRGKLLVDVTYADWHCSNCNYVIKGTVKPKWNYCPNCGADMQKQL